MLHYETCHGIHTTLFGFQKLLKILTRLKYYFFLDNVRFIKSTAAYHFSSELQGPLTLS